ncbi:MAG: hypothetical protein HFF71_04525 [Oscillospiraceae bacterium]|jgi:uncharacterized membrane protein|nr:hypothetical protein [Oscillospiraceae bacterium]
MTLGWRLFMWAAALPVLPIMYFVQKNECKPKKNIIVGVTLPYEAQGDGEVLALLERYKREMKLICWIMLAAGLPSLFLRSFGAFLTVWMLWVEAICVIFFIPYVRCNKALRRLKEARCWRQREEVPQVVTDLQAAAEEIRWLSPWWFLPPFLIALIPLFFEPDVWWAWTVCAVMVPVFYLCYRWLYRNRAEVVDADSQRTMALTRIRRYNWGKFWLVMAWATGIFNALLWLTLNHVWLCMGVCLLYGLITVAEAVSIELRVRRLQEKLTADSGRGYYVDDDDRWLWGAFYYNPDDCRVIVNARTGINATFNLAKRPGQIIALFLAAMMLALPLVGVWEMRMERAPVELEVTETELVGSYFGGEWSVTLEDIAEIQVLPERPKLRRVAGTGMENALTGQFSAEDWGRVTVCIDPRTGPWLLVTAEDGTLYLFGASEEGAAAEIAEAITGGLAEAGQ